MPNDLRQETERRNNSRTYVEKRAHIGRNVLLMAEAGESFLSRVEQERSFNSVALMAWPRANMSVSLTINHRPTVSLPSRASTVCRDLSRILDFRVSVPTQLVPLLVD